jgi:hypothetical protein
MTALPVKPSAYPWRAMVLIGDYFVVTGVPKSTLTWAVWKQMQRSTKRFRVTVEGSGFRVTRIG